MVGLRYWSDMNDKHQDDKRFTASHDIAQRQTAVCKLLTWLYSIIVTLCIRLGFYLIYKGVTGSFEVAFEFKGTKAYFASLAPGLLFLVCGVLLHGFVLSESLDMYFHSAMGVSRSNLENELDIICSWRADSRLTVNPAI